MLFGGFFIGNYNITWREGRPFEESTGSVLLLKSHFRTNKIIISSISNCRWERKDWKIVLWSSKAGNNLPILKLQSWWIVLKLIYLFLAHLSFFISFFSLRWSCNIWGIIPTFNLKVGLGLNRKWTGMIPSDSAGLSYSLSWQYNWYYTV